MAMYNLKNKTFFKLLYLSVNKIFTDMNTPEQIMQLCFQLWKTHFENSLRFASLSSRCFKSSEDFGLVVTYKQRTESMWLIIYNGSLFNL